MVVLANSASAKGFWDWCISIARAVGKIFLGIDGGSDAAKSAAESAANASRAAADAAHSAANATRFIANISAAVADSTGAAASASEAAAHAASYAMWMNVFVIAIIIVIVWCNWTSLLNYVSARPETVLRSEEDCKTWDNLEIRGRFSFWTPALLIPPGLPYAWAGDVVSYEHQLAKNEWTACCLTEWTLFVLASCIALIAFASKPTEVKNGKRNNNCLPGPKELILLAWLNMMNIYNGFDIYVYIYRSPLLRMKQRCNDEPLATRTYDRNNFPNASESATISQLAWTFKTVLHFFPDLEASGEFGRPHWPGRHACITSA